MKPFVTPDSGQRTADTLKFTNHHLPITKSLHFKPSILAFFVASPQKNIDGKNFLSWRFWATVVSQNRQASCEQTERDGGMKISDFVDLDKFSKTQNLGMT